MTCHIHMRMPRKLTEHCNSKSVIQKPRKIALKLQETFSVFHTFTLTKLLCEFTELNLS